MSAEESAHRPARGVLIVGLGVLLLSPDSLLIRLMDMDGATIVFYRGAFSCIGYLLLLMIERRRRPRDRELWTLGWTGIAVGLLTAVSNTLFVTSIRNTSIAHALVIIACAPVLTVLISRVFTREAVPRYAWGTTGVVLAGVLTIFLIRPVAGGLDGDLAGLGVSLVIATMLVIVRRSGRTTILPGLVVGSALMAVASAPFASPLSVSGHDLALATIDALVLLPLALALVTAGPRYLSAPAVSLILLLETVLGPVWAWLFADEAPGLQSSLTGLVIIGALVAYGVLGARAAASPKAAVDLGAARPRTTTRR